MTLDLLRLFNSSFSEVMVLTSSHSGLFLASWAESIFS